MIIYDENEEIISTEENSSSSASDNSSVFEDINEKLDNVSIVLNEINDRQKEEKKKEDVLEKERQEEKVNAAKSASVNLWDGNIVYSDTRFVREGNNYVMGSSNLFDIYKVSLNSSANYVFSFVTNNPSGLIIRLVYYDSNDNVISNQSFNPGTETDVQLDFYFTTPSNANYVLVSFPKQFTNVSLYSDLVGRTNIVYLDGSVDHHDYLTSQVENASINDLYTIGLSCRNILLLFFLCFLGLKLYQMLRSVVWRIMNK